MKIFINDIPFRIIPATKNAVLKDYDVILVEATDKIDFNTFHGDVLIQHASMDMIHLYLQLLKSKTNKKVDSITFQVDNFKEAIDFIKMEYTFIKAAGGLVEHDEHLLLIYRLKKWDLPKGKLDSNENPEITAIREVEEECSIKVELKEKICNTYHTYKRNGKNILKKTYWYEMECVDDSNLKPQVEEDIEEVRWMTHGEVHVALYNSYPSIRQVFRKYYKKKLAQRS
ncbi:MAG: NUDIX hydrolase, partial [Cyclobacteriaceae bacterium]|nr:NUDIX hydrolase [Cyclobacteriaceae bacterium]